MDNTPLISDVFLTIVNKANWLSNCTSFFVMDSMCSSSLLSLASLTVINSLSCVVVRVNLQI